MHFLRALSISLASLAFFGCASSTTSPNGNATPGSCSDITGTWSVGGGCAPDTCTVTQSGCDTNFKCTSGAASFSGTVSGSNVTFYRGTSTCDGTLQNGALGGTCKAGSDSCSFTATRR
jgi:hypothetical protein